LACLAGGAQPILAVPSVAPAAHGDESEPFCDGDAHDLGDALTSPQLRHRIARRIASAPTPPRPTAVPRSTIRVGSRCAVRPLAGGVAALPPLAYRDLRRDNGIGRSLLM
jgi:hypothetical protein